MWNSAAAALRRFFRRYGPGRSGRTAPGRASGINLPAVTLLLGLVLAAALISLFELRLRPMVEQLAAHQVEDRVTRQIHQAVLADLSDRGVSYGDMVQIQRDSEGGITAVTSDMAQINRLQSWVAEQTLDAVEAMDLAELGIPLGSLFDFDLLWAIGPVIEVRGLVSGTVTAEVDSRFESAGINQTLHRLVIHIQVPLIVLLPGGSVKTEVSTDLCVAETVIVGRVPDTYLMLERSGTS